MSGSIDIAAAQHIFLDFDGTLIDSSHRLYDLFCELAPENIFSYQEYWRIKRGRISQRDFLRNYFEYSDEKIAQFHQQWMANIEQPERLATDLPLPGVTEWLQHLARTKKIYLVTARQHTDRARAQLQQLGWGAYFTDIFVTRQRQHKADAIRARVRCTAHDIFVGDTGEDIQAGKALGVRTVAVSSGVLSAEILAEYAPDCILARVTDLIVA